jgi:hypothetical protein
MAFQVKCCLCGIPFKFHVMIVATSVNTFNFAMYSGCWVWAKLSNLVNCHRLCNPARHQHLHLLHQRQTPC